MSLHDKVNLKQRTVHRLGLIIKNSIVQDACFIYCLYVFLPSFSELFNSHYFLSRNLNMLINGLFIQFCGLYIRDVLSIVSPLFYKDKYGVSDGVIGIEMIYRLIKSPGFFNSLQKKSFMKHYRLRFLSAFKIDLISTLVYTGSGKFFAKIKDVEVDAQFAGLCFILVNLQVFARILIDLWWVFFLQDKCFGQESLRNYLYGIVFGFRNTMHMKAHDVICDYYMTYLAEEERKLPKIQLIESDNFLNKEELKVSDELKCPIGLELMQDPVVAFDGITYERKNIEEHLKQGNGFSPIKCSMLLLGKPLIRNDNVKKLINVQLSNMRSG